MSSRSPSTTSAGQSSPRRPPTLPPIRCPSPGSFDQASDVSPSSVRVENFNTFLHFTVEDEFFAGSPRLAASVYSANESDEASVLMSPRYRSQSECLELSNRMRVRLGSLGGREESVAVDEAFGFSHPRSPDAADDLVLVVEEDPPPRVEEEGEEELVMVVEEDPRETPEVDRSGRRQRSKMEDRDHYSTRHMPAEKKTTVMLRNIPNKYTQRMLLDVIRARGFDTKFNFFYLPIDFRNRCNMGYAFVNFINHDAAMEFMNAFEGYKLEGFNSLKVCQTGFSRIQGLDANINHYRNSPVNYVSIPEYRPLWFVEGKEMPFPGPTQHTRKAPHYGGHRSRS
ncbi:hypothetical protein FOZ61_007476 [Perkinsus olseni]|uniref:RRM domain-containing protein n=1 Tax=Perkinsus olseni TaxID=32597 RepID=A0A7J6L8V2_PEROL|nr:hypothetical protein FOZ61_007476 [Perkinsus olseni]